MPGRGHEARGSRLESLSSTGLGLQAYHDPGVCSRRACGQLFFMLDVVVGCS